MGQTYLKTDEDEWSVGVPWIKTTSGGWARARYIYRKTGATTWTSFYAADLSAPPAPAVTVTISENKLKIVVTAPNVADMYRVRVKVGKAVSANNTTDTNYVSNPDGEDAAWSDWLISPAASKTKYWPLSGGLSSGTTYYVTAWAEDKSHNFSTATSKSIKYQSPGTAAPVTKSAVVTPVDSRTWYQIPCNWGNRKEIRVGNPENRAGFLFFSTRLSALLKGAKSITSMKIKLQRMPTIDYDGATKFHIFGHSMPTYSNIDPIKGKKVRIVDTTWSTLRKGQTATFNVPASMFPKFLSGEIVGLGIVSQAGSGINASDPYCGSFYGYGTTSGTITVTYTR